MVAPTPVPDVPPEYGEEAKDFDAEERQAEDLLRAWKPTGQDGARHEGSIGAQAGGELGADTAGVVEEEDVDGEQPEGHGPDAVA